VASLVRPSEVYKDSYIEALQEFRAEARYTGQDAPRISANFAVFVRQLLDYESGIGLAPGRVPDTIYWLVEGDKYIGRVSVRRELNDNLRRIGGHIGYDIRPSERRKGYGTLILRLALEKAKEIGLKQVLITCDFDNIASKKIIEHNGGKLEGQFKVEEQETPILRYWIEIA
jgi:predicted acetyltransferase